MRLTHVVRRQTPDEVFPYFVDYKLQDGERNGGHAEMHEDVVPCSEGSVERLEIRH